MFYGFLVTRRIYELNGTFPAFFLQHYFVADFITRRKYVEIEFKKKIKNESISLWIPSVFSMIITNQFLDLYD